MKKYNDVDVLAYVYYSNEHFASKKNYLPMTFDVFKIISKEFNKFDVFYEKSLRDVRRGKINIIKNKINVHGT